MSRVESGDSEQPAAVQGVRNCYTPTPSSLLVTGHHHYSVTTPVQLAPSSQLRQNMIHTPSVPLVFPLQGLLVARDDPGEVSKWTCVACSRARVRACDFALLCTLQIARTPGNPPERGSFLDPYGNSS